VVAEMGVIKVVLEWIGAPSESAESIRQEVHEKAQEREMSVKRTRNNARRVIERRGNGMSFEELADAVSTEEERRET